MSFWNVGLSISLALFSFASFAAPGDALSEGDFTFVECHFGSGAHTYEMVASRCVPDPSHPRRTVSCRIDTTERWNGNIHRRNTVVSVSQAEARRQRAAEVLKDCGKKNPGAVVTYSAFNHKTGKQEDISACRLTEIIGQYQMEMAHTPDVPLNQSPMWNRQKDGRYEVNCRLMGFRFGY